MMLACHYHECIQTLSSNDAISLQIDVNRRFVRGEFFCINANDHRYQFGLTNEGAFGYLVDSSMVWQPQTRTNGLNGDDGNDASSWIFQSDGNLVIHNVANQAVWASEWESVQRRVPHSHLIMSTSNVMIRSLVAESESVIWNIDIINEEESPLAPNNPSTSCLQFENGHSVQVGKQHYRGDFYCLEDEGRWQMFGLDNQGRFAYMLGDSAILWKPQNSVGQGSWWVFQRDGNLVVYDSTDQTVWASAWGGTGMQAGSILTISKENVMIRASDMNELIWSIDIFIENSTPDDDEKGIGCMKTSGADSILVDVNMRYYRGDFYCLGDGTRLGLTQDGYFGFYSDSLTLPAWEPFAATGVGDSWIFQSDGNLVVYKLNGEAVWSSEWESHEREAGSNLVLSSNGLTIESSREIWKIVVQSLPTIPTPSSTPNDPLKDTLLYLAYYYPWYLKDNWSRHKIQDTPLLGLYGTDSPSIAEQHIEWAIRAGISAWVVSWWGEASLSKKHFDQGMLLADSIGKIKFCMLYESKSLSGSFEDGTAQSKLTSDLRSIRNDYFDHPSYLRLNGRPVIVLYITRAEFGRGFGSHVLDEIRIELGEDIFFIADEPFFENGHDHPATAGNGIQNGQPVFEAYTTYNMFQDSRVIPGETASDFMLREAMPIFERWSQNTLFFPNVLPMYHDFRGHLPLRGSSEDFLRQLKAFMCLKRPDWYDHLYPDILFVTSFNEWWEGTQIEPDSEYRYGFEFIDTLAEFKEDVESNGYYWCR